MDRLASIKKDVCVWRVCICKYCMGWAVEVMREPRKTQQRARKEKSVFLFSISALMSGEAICWCSSTSVIVIASEENVRHMLACQSICVHPCACKCVCVSVTQKCTPLSVEEDRLYISCVYRYRRFSQPFQRHWSMTWKSSASHAVQITSLHANCLSRSF